LQRRHATGAPWARIRRRADRPRGHRWSRARRAMVVAAVQRSRLPRLRASRLPHRRGLALLAYGRCPRLAAATSGAERRARLLLLGPAVAAGVPAHTVHEVPPAARFRPWLVVAKD